MFKKKVAAVRKSYQKTVRNAVNITLSNRINEY